MGVTVVGLAPLVGLAPSEWADKEFRPDRVGFCSLPVKVLPEKGRKLDLGQIRGKVALGVGARMNARFVL